MKQNTEFDIRFGFDKMHFDEVTAMLEKEYWCEGIGRAEVEQGARNSAVVVGVFSQKGEQVGFARAVSDKTRFAYLLDVVVRNDMRGRGIGQRMVRALVGCEDLRDVYQWLLITNDAHELYKKLGFSVVSRPNDWMEIRKPRPAERSG